MMAVYRFANEEEGDNGHFEDLTCSCGGDESCPHCEGFQTRPVYSENMHGDSLKGFLMPDGLFVPFFKRSKK